MIIYLMRHGDAVDPGRWTGGDAARPLTPAGESRLQTAALEMKRLDFSAHRVLVSPVLRARQTAEVLSRHFPGLSLTVCEELRAGARPEDFQKVLRRHADDSPLWIIGHMPDIAVFSGQAAGEPRLMEESFRPGEILALDADHLAEEWGTARVLWRRGLEDWRNVK